jgi:hypothetical protein
LSQVAVAVDSQPTLVVAAAVVEQVVLLIMLHSQSEHLHKQ